MLPQSDLMDTELDRSERQLRHHPAPNIIRTESPPQNLQDPPSHPSMQQLQVFRLLALCFLGQCVAGPLGGQCVDEAYCTSSLEEYHTQLVSLPNSINKRSVAPWTYVEHIDLDRVPQVIYEASCLTSHSCRGMDSSLETLPITVRMPVLRKNSRCATYSLEYEDINIACICATSRQSLF